MKKLIILAVMLSVTACSTVPPRMPVANPGQHWQQRQVKLAKINDWYLEGRAAIINGVDSWNLSITWQRHGDKYILDLSGPFGAGHAQLTGTAEGVFLVDADQNTSFARSPDNLLHEMTGVRMPVKGLLYWMRGIPDPDLPEPKLTLDEFGRVQQMQQDGWRIRFKSYTDVQPFELPQKIFIDSADLKVKIFVDNWDIKSRTFVSESE